MIDYRPDLPPDPSTLQVCAHLIPDKSGQYRTSYAATAVTNWSTALTGSCIGARMVKKADGTPFLFLGSATQIQEWNGVTLTNVSAGGGSPYSAGASNRWWFAQLGDETLACNGTDTTQTRSGATGSAFANHATAPKAQIMVVQSGHVLAFNYNDGSAVPNGVKWASEGSSATWTATAGNTAGNAKLIESSGEITAAAPLHDIVVVWKKYSMYIGKRIGGAGTAVWQFNMLSPKIGAPTKEAWVNTPVGIIFTSTNGGVFRFDGSTPVPIDQGIRNEIYRNGLTGVLMSHDEAAGCVFIWPGSSAVAYCYSYLTNKWSKAYNGSLGNSSITSMQCPIRDVMYDDYTSIGGDGISTHRAHLIVGSDKKVYNLAGDAPANGLSPSLAWYYIRDPKMGPRQETRLTRVQPIFGYDGEAQAYREPSSGTLGYGLKSTISGALNIQSDTFSLDSMKGFDLIKTANTFYITMDFANERLVLQDVAFDTEFGGKR